MSHFQQTISALIERVQNAQASEVRCVEVLTQKPSFAFIEWLHAQPLFPKFYWQSRDTREEVVALGQLHTFSDPLPRTQFLVKTNESGVDARLTGTPQRIVAAWSRFSSFLRLN